MSSIHLTRGCFITLAAVLAGCSQQHQDLREAAQRAAGRKTYVMKNGVESDNYNRRQMLADDPTTILWCTAALDASGGGLITLPVIGKLTSSQKRPFPSEPNGDTIGPDAMYGHSGEYRYGFGTNGHYVEFNSVGAVCFDAPMEWQMKQTKVVLRVDEDMASTQEKARNVLRAAQRDPGTGAYPKEVLDRVGRILDRRE